MDPGTPRGNKRYQIALELQETEQFYVGNLQVLVKFFIEPLRSNNHSESNPSTPATPGTPSPSQLEPVIRPEKAKHLFAGIDQVLEHHERLLQQLKEKLESWETESSTIGDVFENILGTVGGAYTTFTKNFYKATMFITYQEQNNVRFVDFLNDARQISGCKYSIHDLLILPIQRFPHYQLILDRLIKTTAENHPDYSHLLSAQEGVRGVAGLINEKQMDVESHQHLKDLEARMAGTCPPMAIGNRKYVKEIPTISLIEGKREFRHLFIFNDALLCVCRANNLFYRNMQFEFEWMYPIGQVTVEPIQQKILGDNYQDPDQLIRKVTGRMDYRISMKKESFQRDVLINLNKATVGFVVNVKDGVFSKSRYIFAVETEDERDMAILEITKYSKAHQKEINEQPQIPGVLRMHNGFSVDTEASYKALYVASGAKTVEVVRAALDRNGKIKENPADFVIVLEEDGTVAKILGDDDCPFMIHSEIQQDEKRAKKCRMVLQRKGFDTPAIKAKYADPNASQMLRIFCDMYLTNKKGGVSYGSFFADEKTTVASLLESAILKFVLQDKPGFEYALYMYCQETGALRKLFGYELVLKIRDEITLQNMLRKGGSVAVNIRCILRMNPVDKKKIYPIRVYVDKVFPGESYKSVAATMTMVTKEVLEAVLKKFKNQLADLTIDDFVLHQFTSQGEDVLLYPHEVIPPKTSDFVMYLKSEGKSMPKLMARRASATPDKEPPRAPTERFHDSMFFEGKADNFEAAVNIEGQKDGWTEKAYLNFLRLYVSDDESQSDDDDTGSTIDEVIDSYY